ncbi:hypothetical protein Hanom_Chr04g00343641 [Helianthus anomalus]
MGKLKRTIVTGLVFDPHVVSLSPPGQPNPSYFFVWVTGFVLPWTHQESGTTNTSSLTLTPSPDKVPD